MTAWTKTKLQQGSVQLWLRVDVEGQTSLKRDCFDNMGDRPIKGNTQWQQQTLVVDVPTTSALIYFGCMLFGTGEVWFDDVTIEAVSRDVPLTGNFTSANGGTNLKKHPINLNFEE